MLDTPEPGRLFDDFTKARVGVYDQVLSAAQTIKPVEYGGRRVEVLDVGYDPADDDDDENERFGFDSQAKAVRDRTTLGRRLRATVRMSDLATGDVLEEQRKLMAVVPRVNEDGTMIYRGSRYNVVNQQRLKPAVYGRVKKNEELEVMANPSPGSGSTHRYIFNPESSVFFLSSRNSKVPLVPLLRALGVEDDAIRAAWGDEIAEKNFAKRDGGSLDKLYERLVPKKLQEPHATPEFKQIALRQAIGTIKLDPWSTKKILGIETDHLTPEVILRSTAKTLEMSRGLSQGDDRDSLAFQTVHGVEDLMAERFRLDSGHHQKNSLRKALWRGNLKALPAKFLQPHIESTIFGSGLGIMPEYANPLDAWDRASRVTKLGEGGIACYSDDTEVFTRTGWKLWSNVTATDYLLCSVEGKLCYRLPIKLYKGWHDGSLLRFRTKRLDLLVTEDHRIYCRLYGTDGGRGPEKRTVLRDWMFATAASRFGKSSKLPVSLGQQDVGGEDPVYFELQPAPVQGKNAATSVRHPVKVPFTAWVRFMAAFLADGNVEYNTAKRRYKVQITKLAVNAVERQLINSALDDCGLTYCHCRGGRFSVSGKHVANYLLRYGQSADKYVPEYIMRSSPATRRLFLDHITTFDNSASRPGYRLYQSRSCRLRDDVAELAIRAGFAVTYGTTEKIVNGASYLMHQVVIKEDTESHISRQRKKDQFSVVPYRGFVYCAQVEGSLVLVRRNGKTVWCGNSTDSVPMESRDHHSSHQGFIDPARTSECGPGYMEAMTDIGWIRLDELTPESKLACLIDGRVEFHKPDKLMAYDYDGILHGFRSKTVAYEVTPDHRMWTACSHSGSLFRFETAVDIAGKSRVVLCGGHLPYRGELDNLKTIASPVYAKAGCQAFKLPPCFAVEDWAEFMGWFLSEGSTGGDSYRDGKNTVHISQSREANPQTWSRINDLLTRMRLKFHGSNRGFSVNNTHLASYCQVFGTCEKKYIPTDIFEYPVEARRRFLEALMLGDGGFYKHQESGKRILSTASGDLAQDVQTLAFGLGYSINETTCKDKRKESYHLMHLVMLHTRTRRKIGRTKITDGGTYQRPHAGKVYCASVPGGLMYWRMPGYGGFWIGNSLKVGIDVNFAAGARKGPDGKVYTQLINARTGELEFVTPERASEAVVAFQAHDKEVPGYMLANVRGSERFVKPSRVDYIQPDSERSAFSTLSNLTPMKGLQPQNRTAMSARFLSQAVPLKNREAPWVQVAVPGTDRNESFEQHYADRVGLRRAPAGGQVVAVKPNAIQIETPDGIRTVGLHVNTPLGRKTNLVNSPIVRVGDKVEPGQPLATSNYTDQSGTMALGLNARVAYTPWGDNYEDAYTISQSFANRMASEHSYDFRRDNDPEARTSVNDYISALPREYNREQVERMDPDGVVRVGTVVKQGDPLVLSAKRRSANMSKRVSRTGAISFTDDSQQWGHDDPGIVTNVHRTKNGGAVVTVATASPLRDADKLCYSADTEVLTDEGWVFVDELTTDHRVATLLDGVRFDYVNPVAINVFEHSGDMYHAESTQVDLLVTGNHRLYAKPRSAKWAVGHQQISPFDVSGYRLIPAETLFGREYRLKRDGVWVGHSPDSFVLEEEVYEQGMRQLTSGLQRTFTTRKSREIPPEAFACILGAFLSEGSLINNPKSGTYGIRIAQHKLQWRQRFAEMLTKWGIKFGSDATGFTIFGKQWLQWFDEFTGIDSYTKYIPAYAFSWSTELQRVLLEWMVWGDGHVPDRGSDTYYTSSKRLADDVQRLLLHVGLSGNIKWRSGYSHRIKGVYTECRESYIVTIFASKQHPTINHSHVKKQGAQTEEWSQYEGMVYCPTMPYGNVIYVRRNGKPVWCGNSERGGNKGIVRIIPDDEMLQDQNGQPFDVVASDLGLISRKNDSRAYEALLGKIAAKTGKPYRLEEMSNDDVWQLVRDGLDQNGLSDTETVVDPTNGRKIPNVFTGVQYMLKLQHMAECFDDQTEVLTDHGWKFWSAVTASDRLATVDADDRLCYELPIALVATDYDGPMYRYAGRYVDFCVTPNHSMYIRRYYGKEHWHLRPISTIAGSRYAVRQFGFREDPAKLDLSSIVIGDLRIAWDDYAELVGWWATEGYTKLSSRKAYLVLYQSDVANPQYLEKIKRLLDRIGLKWHWYKVDGVKMGIGLYHRELVTHLHSYGTHHWNKRLPRELLAGPVSARQVLVETIIDGDGHRRFEKYGYGERYTTTSKQLADDLQELLIRIGLGGVVREVYRKNKPKHHKRVWEVGLALKRTDALIDSDRHPEYLTVEQYCGRVYCAETRTGLLYVRRNGKPILTGNSKAHGRGVGAYSSDGQPAKGAEEGLQAKRFSSQELGAMVSHGAFQHLKEVALVRGQRNDEYWARFINGHDLPEPKVPMVYNKFLAYLKGMGVNPVRTGTKTKLLLLDDKGTAELAEGRTVRSGETVNMAKDLKPAPGGLFDPALFGGDGDKFASYELDEPIPHPMMEDALRTLMGVTKDGFRNILSGQQPFGQHGTGPQAIQGWLAKLNPANELAAARLMANDPRKTKREEAIKKMRYLAGLTSRNIQPETLMIRYVPIIPPIFRPISRLDNNNTPLIDGMNLLYRDMIAADENHRKVKQFSSDTSNERLGVYDAVQAAVGLRQPLDPELERKSVTGIMARLVGKGGPKTSFVSRKLLSGTVDSVGRAVIGPDAKLGLDQVGIPEEQAWSIYEAPILRNMTRRGVALAEARESVKRRDKAARQAMEEELSHRPVMVSRAPVLHKYGAMTFWPKLVKGTSLHMNPLVYSGYGADNDGDAVNFHALITEEAIREAKQKTMPSRSLISPKDFKRPMFVPGQDHALGIYLASTATDDDERLHVFADRDAARRAFRRGEISVSSKIKILG